MNLRLIVGTINDWPDEDGWRNFTLDANPRGVWNRDLSMTVAPSFVGDVRNLSEFRDETFDEVRLHHVLEHLPRTEYLDGAEPPFPGSHEALSEVARVLKQGGVLDVEVPDVDRILEAYENGDLDLPGLSQWLLGEQLANHALFDCHRSIWTSHGVRVAVAAVGLAVPDVGTESSGYAVRFRAVKP